MGTKGVPATAILRKLSKPGVKEVSKDLRTYCPNHQDLEEPYGVGYQALQAIDNVSLPTWHLSKMATNHRPTVPLSCTPPSRGCLKFVDHASSYADNRK